METREETVAEMVVEQTEEQVDDAEDDADNCQAVPLKDDAKEPEIVGETELVPFLCWKLTKEKRKKVLLSCALYFGFFALVRNITSPIPYFTLRIILALG